MKTRLDSFEKEIENNTSAFKPVSGAKLKKIESIIDAAKKVKNVNIQLLKSGK